MTETLDTEHVGRVVRKALDNARQAGFPSTKQMEHAVRAAMQAFPQLSEKDAVVAVERIKQRM